MKKTILCVAIAGVIAALPVRAEDHLIPENSIYSPLIDFQPGYLQLEMHVFAPAFNNDVQARVIVEPSFSDEFAVGVKENSGAYSLFYDVAPQHLWNYVSLQMMKNGEILSSKNGKSTTSEEIKKLEASLPSDPRSIKLIECEFPVDASLGQSLEAIWRALLLETHYDPEPTLGVDGDFYHFSMHSGHQELTGKVWSPPDRSDIGHLVNIVYSIKKACPARDRAIISGLREQISGLQQLLPRMEEENRSNP